MQNKQRHFSTLITAITPHVVLNCNHNVSSQGQVFSITVCVFLGGGGGGGGGGVSLGR